MSSSPVRVLVVWASRHGATAEIAETLTRAMCHHGADGTGTARLTATAHRADRAPDPARYEAVVLGSAVYAGRWLPDARDYARGHASALRGRPVWLFSSGPIGDPPYPTDEPHDVAALTRLTGARQHRLFPGRLDQALLGFGERALVTAMRAPLGDSRDWDAVRSWAAEIVDDLTSGVPRAIGAPADTAPMPVTDARLP